MMNYSVLIFLITLPNLFFGQGFILEHSEILFDFDFTDVKTIEPIYSSEGHNIIISTKNNYLYDFNTLKQIPIPGKSSHDNYLNSNGLLHFNNYISTVNSNEELLFLNLKNNKVKKKKISKNKDYVIEYAFEDESFIYLFSYYNKSFYKNKNYDYVHMFKVSKKTKKIVKKTSINIGKEILLSPFNNQLITFNNHQFIIGSSITSKLLFLDKNFIKTDSLVLNKEMHQYNPIVFDSIFPEKDVRNYLYRAKSVISKYLNSEMNNIKIIKKLLYINKNTLLVSYRLKHRELYQIVIYNLRNKKPINEFIIPHSGSTFSNFCWTRRIYANQDNELIFINHHILNDTTLAYRTDIFSYNTNQIIEPDSLNQFYIYNSRRDSIDLQEYSGVILADISFCKSCYSGYGTGKGVLVIKKDLSKSKASLLANNTIMRREWKINGGLGFVDETTFNKLKSIISPNILYPINNLK